MQSLIQIAQDAIRSTVEFVLYSDLFLVIAVAAAFGSQSTFYLSLAT